MRTLTWRTRLLALAAAAAAIGAPSLVAPARADVAPLSWYGYEGSSMVADTVAESIIQGDTLDQALSLVGSLASLTDTQTLSAITTTILNPPDPFDTETVVTRLLDIAGSSPSDIVTATESVAPSTTSDAGVPKGRNERHGHGGGTTVQPAVADQYDNGEPKATGYYSWLHRGSHTLHIYLGTCSLYSSSCSTVGYIRQDYSANTYYGYDFALSDELEPRSISATFSNYVAKLRKDINNWPDSTVSTYSCSGSGYAYHSCNTDRSVPAGTGNWYYQQINFRMSYGSTVADVQMQTRRAEVISAGAVAFQIYASGG